MSVGDVIWLVLVDAWWSGLAAVGFAMLFNVPRRQLPGSFLAGALGHSARTLLVELGAPLEAASLAGGVVVGLVGNALAWRLATPTFVFTVPGVIPMVPGVFAFRTMMAILRLTTAVSSEGPDLLADAGILGIRTALILAALALGISAPRLLFRHPRPVV